MRRLSCIFVVSAGLFGLGLVSCESGEKPDPSSQTGSGGQTPTTGGNGIGGASDGGSSRGAISGGGMKGDPDLPFARCATAELRAALTQANLLFVIDKSGSMSCNPPNGDSDLAASCRSNPVRQDPAKPSKWEVAAEALSSALDSLVGAPNVHVALSVFPTPDGENGCYVAAQPDVPMHVLDATQKSAITAFLSKVTPEGNTPIAGATILGYEHLKGELEAGRLEGNTFVVLVTDGTETCDGKDVVNAFVQKDVPDSQQFGVRTFVIGAPGSEDARSLLSEIAFRGGTPSSSSCVHGSADGWVGNCHFDTTTASDFASDLGAAIRSITDERAFSCAFDMPKDDKGGAGLDSVNVTFTPSGKKPHRILKDDKSPCDGGADGWQYSSDRSHIVLCGPACEEVKADPDGEVQIVLGCPTETVVR